MEAYAKIVTKQFVLKGVFVNGQNLYDNLMIGGYLAYGTVPNITYKPIQVNSAWVEIAGTGKKVIPGFFLGYTKNNGSNNGSNAVASYARGIVANGVSIDNIFRVAPRLEMVSGKFKFSTEFEITRAGYGMANGTGKVTGIITSVTNTRILFATIYSF
jgi:hypothetical protein